MPQLRIGQVAAKVGINPKTIRFYEQMGLLPSPVRTQAGYRVYDAADYERLQFIGKAKATGFTLAEIGECECWDKSGTVPAVKSG